VKLKERPIGCVIAVFVIAASTAVAVVVCPALSVAIYHVAVVVVRHKIVILCQPASLTEILSTKCIKALQCSPPSNLGLRTVDNSAGRRLHSVNWT